MFSDLDSLELLRFRFKRAAELKHGRVAMLVAWMYRFCVFGFPLGGVKMVKCLLVMHHLGTHSIDKTVPTPFSDQNHNRGVAVVDLQPLLVVQNW